MPRGSQSTGKRCRLGCVDRAHAVARLVLLEDCGGVLPPFRISSFGPASFTLSVVRDGHHLRLLREGWWWAPPGRQFNRLGPVLAGPLDTIQGRLQ